MRSGQLQLQSINPTLYKSLKYDVKKDLQPVAHIANAPTVLIANSKFTPNNIKELIAFSKSNPTAVHYGSGGSGTSVHLAGEQFRALTNSPMIHIPYRGSAPAVTDLIGGQIQLIFDTAPSAVPHVKGGRVKALAVTGQKRLDELPQVPTFTESGLSAFDAPAWYGLLAPTGVPATVVQYLNTEINQILKEPTVQQRLVQMGTVAVGGSTEEFAKFMDAENKRWGTLIRNNKFTSD